MPLSTHLRVIGSRDVFRFFLPGDQSVFQSSEFILVEPHEAAQRFTQIPQDGALNIIVNPDDYHASEVILVSGNFGLWFLRRLVCRKGFRESFSPRLARHAEALAESRRTFLFSLPLEKFSKVVVSDAESEELVLAGGPEVLLSPPPVSDSLSKISKPVHYFPRFTAAIAANEYSRHFSEVLETQLPVTLDRHGMDSGTLFSASHFVIAGESVARSFSYEAAIGFAAGKTVISEPMAPLWGFEPGIDYLEFSTPEELLRMIQSIERSPAQTRLMALRGQKKAAIFSAERIWRRLAIFLDQ